MTLTQPDSMQSTSARDAAHLPADTPASVTVPSLPGRVGYVVKVYPRFSETFVVTEILAREAAGEQLSIFALRPTTDARFHPQLGAVRAPVEHLRRSVKLSDGWATIARAQRELPDFARRWAEMMPFLACLPGDEALQGIELALAARSAKVTHLHAHFASVAGRVTHIAAGLTDITYSITTHAKDLFHEDVDQALLSQILAAADHVIAISEYNSRFLTGLAPELDARLHLVRNGLELTRFPYRDPRPPGAELQILAVGRLVEKKGFDHLIDAVHRARLDGQQVRLRIAGDGELREHLCARVDECGLADIVELLGPCSQDELSQLLDHSDVLAAPCVVGGDGNADGLPTVLLEAMARGVPVISTSVTGIPEAVRTAADGSPDTGILLSPGDVPALVKALASVHSPDLDRVDIARRARALIESEFDSRRQGARLTALQQAGTRKQ